MQKMASGFEVAVHYCATCAETAEGLPGTGHARGLLPGWIAVEVSCYKRLSCDKPGEPTNAYHLRTVYFCSESHLPSELLPPDEPGG